MRRIKNKKLAILAGSIATMMVAGAAFAYWTAAGTGSGDATVGTDDGVTIGNVLFVDNASDTDTSEKLYPGSNVDVTFDITNDSDNTPVAVGDVVADQGVLDDQGTPSLLDDTYEWPNGFEIDAVGCDPAWFSYTGTTVDQEIAHNATLAVGAGDGGTIAMTDPDDENQDACKDAVITLHLIVDNGSITL
jgi:hypothetical protein